MSGNVPNRLDYDVLDPPLAESIKLGPWRPADLSDISLDEIKFSEGLRAFSNSLIRAPGRFQSA